MTTFLWRYVMALMVFVGSVGLLAGAGPRDHHVQFGVDTYLGIYHLGTELGSSIKPSATDRTNYLNAVRELGATTIREDIGIWSEIQPKEGDKYHFEVIDDLVRKASDRNIDVLALVYFFPPWATVGEDRPWNFVHGQDGRYNLPLRNHEGEFKEFIKTMVTRYCGCRPDSLRLKKPVKEWLFMNEPDVYAGVHFNVDEYAHWLRVFYEQIKSVDPGAKVVAPALADPGFGAHFLPDLLSSKELRGPHYPYFDILDFHPYPISEKSKPNPYTANICASYLRQVMLEHKLNLPMWVTEIGDNSIDLTLQADRIVEYVVEAASVGVDRVYDLGLWDFNKKLYNGHPWGLLEETPSGQVPVPKPSFIAYQTLLHKITNNRGIDFLGPGRYRVNLDSGKPLYILWVQGEYSATPAFLHGRLQVTNLKNQTTEMDTKELKLTEHPVLVQPSD